jgi:DNA-binding NtrC family response regulator
VSTLLAGAVAVVEDDEAMRQAIRRVLQTQGFVTEVFGTPEAFLASGAASRAARSTTHAAECATRVTIRGCLSCTFHAR